MNFLAKLKSNDQIFVNFVILILFIVYFRSAIIWIFETIVNFAIQGGSLEYGIASGILVFYCLYALYKKVKNLSIVSFNFSLIPFTLLNLVLFVELLNTLFVGSSILRGALFLFGLYSLLGLYVSNKAWKECFFIILTLIATLPFLYRIQVYLGFPIRLITAKVVSVLLNALGLQNFTESTVIVTENNASSIDLPCSGINSLYVGTLFMLLLFNLKQVMLSVKTLVVSFLFILSLLIFNIWRVFSLVYVYDILEMKEFGDSIHLVLGLLGFTLSCAFLMLVTERFLPKASLKKELNFKEKVWYFPKSIVLITLLCFLVIQLFVVTKREKQIFNQKSPLNSISLSEYPLTELPFTKKEEKFFLNSDVEFSKKYAGKVNEKTPFSLLIVKSKSWRTHHNPEICLQALGYTVEKSEIVQSNGLTMRKLTLNKGEATVYYWFTNGEISVMDYSQRVWEGMFNNSKSWSLVEVGFTGNAYLNNTQIPLLLLKVNESVKEIH